MLGPLGYWGLIQVRVSPPFLSRMLSSARYICSHARLFLVVIKFLGFKDKSELAFEDNVRHSFFIYPDEMVHFVKNPLSFMSHPGLTFIQGVLGQQTYIQHPPQINAHEKEDWDRTGAHYRDVICHPSSALCFLKYVLIFLVIYQGFSGTNNGSQAKKVVEGGWNKPPGFHIVPLPFADDIRAAPIEEGYRGALFRVVH